MAYWWEAFLVTNSKLKGPDCWNTCYNSPIVRVEEEDFACQMVVFVVDLMLAPHQCAFPSFGWLVAVH